MLPLRSLLRETALLSAVLGSAFSIEAEPERLSETHSLCSKCVVNGMETDGGIYPLSG